MPSPLLRIRTLWGVVLCFVLAATAVVVLPHAAAAQTVGDVEARDGLIANQEALLNTYRCRFNIDTEIVPGGCADGAPSQPAAQPAPFTGTPTAVEIEARDGLIQAQEALLNTYRCRFNIDTEIVPGGCVDGAPAVVEPPLPPLGPPPAELGFDPFYQKYLDAGGIPIVTSAAVPDEALYATRDLFFDVLANRPDLIEALAESGMHVTLMAEGSVITEIPEFSQLNEQFPSRDWNVTTKGGGLGPTTSLPVMTAAVENVLCLESEVFPHEDVMIHEIGHAVLNMAIEFQMGDTEFRDRIKAAYQSALDAGLWENTYAATDEDEYWAEGTVGWFNLNSPPSGTHNNINTRAELLEYDPALAELLDEVYGDASAPSSCHETVDISANLIEGVVLGPDDQPVENILLWFWQGTVETSAWAHTDADGSFYGRVVNGTFSIDIHADPTHECSFVGWWGEGGLTTEARHITYTQVRDTDIDGIVIKLPDDPENLPYAGQCATRASRSS
ncbi:hypothetical protein [Candidatus Poriferisocius sp.]|uniref:hypothetical protein n=1 Tax=Candidatus Poriferisocius sp. TaxID=3101276 RepID=UPI003B02E9E5